MAKKLSGSAFKKIRLEKEERESEVIKKTQKLDNFFLIKPPLQTSLHSQTSTPTTISIDTTRDQEHEQNDDFNNKLVSQVTNTKCTELFKNVVDNSNLNSLPLDPYLWKLNDRLIDIILSQNISTNINDIDFSKTARLCGQVMRRLTPDIFERKLLNNEVKFRDWLLYSKSTCSLFCGPCRIFSKIRSQFSETGFNNWKKVHSKVSEHEKSNSHLNAVRDWVVRSDKLGKGTLDHKLKIQIESELQYWRSVLNRVVAVIKFLSSRGLAFRGENEVFGSNHNGNFLGSLELLAKFDPFLAKHIETHGNKGRGHVSYLSSTICDEFILIMGNKVIKKIIDELKLSKYYSIIIDSTPDVFKIDQLTLIVRYILPDGTPIERFLKFLPSVGHKSADLELAVLNEFKQLGINIEDCRGQSYDNAKNMSGVYSGMQARIRQVAKYAEFIPCSAHSLNLVGANAAQCSENGQSFFFLLENLFVFFSSSTHRWEILNKHLNSVQNIEEKNSGTELISAKKTTLKKLCTTRWSCRDDACTALYNGLPQIKKALEELIEDRLQKSIVQLESKSLLKKLCSLETAFMIMMWAPILKRFNITSKTLQTVNTDLSTVVTLYDSLVLYIKEFRNKFDQIEQSAKQITDETQYSSELSRRKKKFFLMKKILKKFFRVPIK